MERGEGTVTRAAASETDAKARDAAGRVLTTWGFLCRGRGDAASARDAMERARALATSAGDRASTIAMSALLDARTKPTETPWGAIDAMLHRVLHVKARDGDGTRTAVLGARVLSALTRFRQADALEAAMQCDAVARDLSDENLELAQESPHGWAVATALKTLGHVERLRGDAGRALELYERASEYAENVSRSEHVGAMASRYIADEIKVDCSLALAQVYAETGDLESAETAAATALSGAEALGDERHPRVGVAIAASGDVYVAKALRASTAEAGMGDGAGVMFAEGLYNSALKLMHYPNPVEDAHVGELDYEARHLCAVLHARYSSILRASGPQRASEADKWLASAKFLWPDEWANEEGGVNGDAVVTKLATKLGVRHGGRIVIDMQQLTPFVLLEETKHKRSNG